jgi:hypothetical protein
VKVKRALGVCFGWGLSSLILGIPNLDGPIPISAVKGFDFSIGSHIVKIPLL